MFTICPQQRTYDMMIVCKAVRRAGKYIADELNCSLYWKCMFLKFRSMYPTSNARCG